MMYVLPILCVSVCVFVSEAHPFEEDALDLSTGDFRYLLPEPSSDIQPLPVPEKKYALALFFKANWFRAGQYCRYRGMQLATIESEEEEKLLETTVESVGFNIDHIWTSGTDFSEEGKFFWMSTGTPVSYTKWHDGEPNDNGSENCLVLRRGDDGDGYFWNDLPCAEEHYFACQYYPLKHPYDLGQYTVFI